MYEPIFDEFTAPMDDSSMFDFDERDDSDGDDHDHWVCLYPGQCCMPFEHTSDECHTVAMKAI